MEYYGVISGNLRSTPTVLNGNLTAQGGIHPSGIYEISQNGLYNVTEYAFADVDVAGTTQPSGTTEINITANGTTTEDVKYYEFAEINVNVPNTYTAGDEGKVVSDGELVAQGSTTLSENGNYDTTLIDTVEVSVSGQTSSGTKEINIIANGTTTENVAGYANAEINVNVPNSYSSGDEGKVVDDGRLVAQTSKNINSNGTHDTTTNNEVVVNVPNTYEAGDEGKVVHEGQLVGQTSDTYTSNGTYDTTLIDEVVVNVSGGTSPNLQTVSKTYTPTESQQTEQVTPGTGYDGLAKVNVTVNAISSSYVGSGITRRDDTDLSASGATVTAPAGYYAEPASKAVATGTAGTPSATKGAVSNHSIEVTPSVTNSAGYIASETKTGTPVTVQASELVSGSETKTQNGTYDVTNLAELVVNVSGGGGGGGLTIVASGTFTGAGSYQLVLSVGKKMPKTDFWVKYKARANSEFPYNENYKPAYVLGMLQSDLGYFDLSEVGDNRPTVSSLSYDVNNDGTIASASACNYIGQYNSVRRNTANNTGRFNNFNINRKSDHFEVKMFNSNNSNAYENGIVFDWEIVYFGSNAATDIVEIP